MLELTGIGWSAGGRAILDGVDLTCPPGSITMLLGPNGAGKSTLLRIAAGLLRPDRGEVRFDGRPLASFAPRALARRRAVLSQHAEPAFPLSALDVVEMGRYPYHGNVPGSRDHDAVARALDAVGMSDRRHQPFATLSAGERQAVQMARVLAQIDGGEGAAPGVLFLDEPTSNLDVRHQIHLLGLTRDLAARGVTVVAVLHDLNHACEYGDRLVLLDHGRIVYESSREQGVPADVLGRVYGVVARRVNDPAGGTLWRFGG